MANKNAVIVGVVVIIVAVAAVAVFALNNGDKDEKKAFGVGDSMTFEVFGTYGDDGTLIDGTVTLKVVDETDTQFKYELEQSIYTVGTDGTRTAVNVGKTTEWEDKDDDDDMVSKGTLTVDTFWGEKKLSYYQSEDGTQHVLADGYIIYAGKIEGDYGTMYLELTDCTAIKDEKVNREIHEATIAMAGEAESYGYEFDVTMTYTMDNRGSAIFTRNVVEAEVSMSGTVQNITNETSWNDPFSEGKSGMVKTGTETIDTVWGTKETDIYEQVKDGTTTVMYAYKEVPVRMTVESAQMTMTLDSTSIIYDGKEVDLDKVAEL